MGKSNYFSKKRFHTEMKHELLKATLMSSISIANKKSGKKYKNNNYYIFDLCAGKGIFGEMDSEENVEKGSPLIILETACRFLKGESKINFDKIKMIFFEKDEKNYQELIQLVNNEYTKYKLEGTIIEKPSIYLGKWQLYANSKFPKNEKWGFIFADPFGTDIDLKLLFSKINENKFFDVMIFVNHDAIRRLVGKGLIPKLIEDLLNDNFQKDFIPENLDLIRGYLVKLFKKHLDKTYISGAAIPITLHNNKLINKDFAFIVLGTSSVGVNENFMKTYEKIRNSVPHQLFLFKTTLNDIIEKYLQGKKQTTLLELHEFLNNRFFSWKKRTWESELPTIKNIKKALKELAYEGKISYNKSNIIASKKELEKTIICYLL